jgi:hypothetical protein
MPPRRAPRRSPSTTPSPTPDDRRPKAAEVSKSAQPTPAVSEQADSGTTGSDIAGTNQEPPFNSDAVNSDNVNSDAASEPAVLIAPSDDDIDDAALLAEAGNSEDLGTQIHSNEPKDKEDERRQASLQVNDRSGLDGLKTPEENPETEGKTPVEDAEIARLRAELAASAQRFELLQQKLRASLTPARREFSNFLYANEPSNGPNIVTFSSSHVSSANKRQNQLSFTQTNPSSNQEQQDQQIRQETATPVNISSGDEANRSTSPSAKKTRPGDLTPPPKPQTTEGIACVKNGVSKKTDADTPAVKRSGSANEAENQVATSPYTGPGAGICSRRAFTAAEAGLALQKGRETGENVPLPPQPPRVSAAVVGAPRHDDNVAALLKFWPHADVVAALAQTMSEDGAEDLQAAHEHLVQQRNRRIAREVRISEIEQQKDPVEPEEAIRADGELAAILASHPNAINAVLHLVNVHQRIRNAHSTESGRTAANLIAHRLVQNFSGLKQISPETLQKIAQSVVYDCRACEALRVKAKAAKHEADKIRREAEARKAKEQSAKAAEEERKRRAAADKKDREERERQRNRQAATPPLDELDDGGQQASAVDSNDVFNPSDAKWAKRRKAEICWNCGKGGLGGNMEQLYICDICDKCFHKPCTQWTKVLRTFASRRSSDYKFACRHCCRDLPRTWRFYIENEEEEPEQTPPRNRQEGASFSTPNLNSNRSSAAAPAFNAAPPPHGAPRISVGDSTFNSNVPPNGQSTLLNSTIFLLEIR